MDSIEALVQLQKNAFERFKYRGEMEWKRCVSLWTVLVVLLGLIVKGDIELETTAKYILSGTIFLSFLIHFYWTFGIAETYKIDNHTQRYYEKAILEKINVSDNVPVAQQADEKLDKSGTVTNWYHVFHLGITFILSACIIASVWIVL